VKNEPMTNWPGLIEVTDYAPHTEALVKLG
jgi:hypothetical protein